MRQQLGEAYDPGTYAWLSGKHGDAGVPRDVVEGLMAARRQAMEPATDPVPVQTGLRAVGGAR